MKTPLEQVKDDLAVTVWKNDKDWDNIINTYVEERLKEERDRIWSEIEEADFARKVGEKTGNAEAVYEVQDVIRKIQALTTDTNKDNV